MVRRRLGLLAVACGRPAADPPGLAEPYRLLLAGDWRAAAAAWQALGCPYQRALALACGDQDEALLEAVALLDGLGARQTAQRLRRQLRRRGSPRVPRPDPGHGRQPGRAHRPAGRGAEVAGRRAQQRRSPRACRYRPRPSSTTSRRCWPSSRSGSRRQAATVARRLGVTATKDGVLAFERVAPILRLLRLLGCAGKSVQEVEHEQATSGCLGACGVGPLGGSGRARGRGRGRWRRSPVRGCSTGMRRQRRRCLPAGSRSRSRWSTSA